MSISDLNAVKNVTSLALSSIGDEKKEIAKQIKDLFSTTSFYNGNNASANAIREEIKKLEEAIVAKNEEYKQTYTLLKLTSTKLNQLNEELELEIYEVTKQADQEERVQKVRIQRAIDEVNSLYMSGKIEKSEMNSELAKRVAKYNGLSPDVVAKSMDLNNTKSKIAKLTSQLASIIDRANSLELESKIAQGTKVMLENLASKMGLNSSNRSVAANERPVYTPVKEAIVDKLAKGIKGTGNGDMSMGNQQVVKMREFLGMNGNGEIDSRTGVKKDSCLLEMKNAGFTQKEAMYAINWIFDNCYMGYNVSTGGWSVPYGHDTGSATAYAELINQVQALWGANATQFAGTTDPVNPSDPVTETPGPVDPANPVPEEPVVPINPVRTDPIGYAVGNKTYEFVIDRDHDGVYDGKSEFLGAQTGINELRALDKNGDNVVDSNEMAASGLFVLMTDHQNGSHSFMSANDGDIASIDLNTITSQNWTNINDNQLKNIFTINTVTGGTVKGYQTDDSNYYISKVYNGVEGAEMEVSVDSEALERAENIFKNINTISDAGLSEKADAAASSVKIAQNRVNRVENRMEENDKEAVNGLYKGKRPETAEEKAERLKKEEAKKAEEEKRAAELAKKAQEKAKAEEEEEEENK